MVLIPEGLIEFVPEVNVLLAEINELLAHGTQSTVTAVADALSLTSASLFNYLPPTIKQQLLADRDPHGNVQVSLIETEKLLAELVQHELDKLARAGKCPLPAPKGHWPASFQYHFFGYEGVRDPSSLLFLVGGWQKSYTHSPFRLSPPPRPPPLPFFSAALCPVTLTQCTAMHWA